MASLQATGHRAWNRDPDGERWRDHQPNSDQIPERQHFDEPVRHCAGLFTGSSREGGAALAPGWVERPDWAASAIDRRAAHGMHRYTGNSIRTVALAVGAAVGI